MVRGPRRTTYRASDRPCRWNRGQFGLLVHRPPDGATSVFFRDAGAGTVPILRGRRDGTVPLFCWDAGTRPVPFFVTGTGAGSAVFWATGTGPARSSPAPSGRGPARRPHRPEPEQGRTDAIRGVDWDGLRTAGGPAATGWVTARARRRSRVRWRRYAIPRLSPRPKMNAMRPSFVARPRSGAGVLGGTTSTSVTKVFCGALSALCQSRSFSASSPGPPARPPWRRRATCSPRRCRGTAR